MVLPVVACCWKSPLGLSRWELERTWSNLATLQSVPDIMREIFTQSFNRALWQPLWDIRFRCLLNDRNYKEYLVLLKAADYLGIDCIVQSLNVLLEGVSEVFNAESISAVYKPSSNASQKSEESGQLSAQDFLHELLNLPCIVVSKYLEFSHDILLYAAKMGYAGLIQDLLEKGVDLSGPIGDDSALTLAYEHGHTAIVELLLEATVLVEENSDDPMSDAKVQ